MTSRPIRPATVEHPLLRPQADREEVCTFFPGAEVEELPDREAGRSNGSSFRPMRTHLDAPYHFAPTMDRGKRAATIDEIPLECA